MDIRPNHTLYVNNLNDKLKKADLKRALYYLFSPYGRVLEIIAMKTPKMRGQAFIIFQAITSATTALRVLQGFQLFDKVICVLLDEFFLSQVDSWVFLAVFQSWKRLMWWWDGLKRFWRLCNCVHLSAFCYRCISSYFVWWKECLYGISFVSSCSYFQLNYEWIQVLFGVLL